jgi:hypothetical protein
MHRTTYIDLFIALIFQYDGRRPSGGGKQMWFLKKALPVAVSLALVAAVTAILWYINVAAGVPNSSSIFICFP